MHAHNLEMLRFNISENISVANVKTMSWWIGLFGKNLAKCSKLRELTIFAYKSTKIGHFSYISDVINALIPTISTRKDSIEKFSLYTIFSCDDYMVNFFAAV